MGHQFVVQLENRPGELARLARALATRGINITQLSCAGAGTIACAFMTTSDATETREVLRGLGHEYVEGKAVVVEVLDKPGGLADVAEKFAAAGVNIQGTLCIGHRDGMLEMAFVVDDEAKAREALSEAQLAGVR